MGPDVVKINCLCSSTVLDSLPYYLLNLDEYKFTDQEDDLIVEFKIGGKNIRIKLTWVEMENIHVYLVDSFMNRSNEFSDDARRSAQYWRKQHPTVPFMLVCIFAERKHRPGEMKKAELNGDDMMNRQIGDKLAHEIGAVKYVECSNETGRGAKILIDEIAFAGIEKIKDDEKRRGKKKCNII